MWWRQDLRTATESIGRPDRSSGFKEAVPTAVAAFVEALALGCPVGGDAASLGSRSGTADPVGAAAPSGGGHPPTQFVDSLIHSHVGRGVKGRERAMLAQNASAQTR